MSAFLPPRPPMNTKVHSNGTIVDDFALAAGGIEKPEPRSRSGVSLSPQSSVLSTATKVPTHPGFTRRDIEALVDAEVLRGWVVTRPWRVTLVLAGLILGSWCLLAGAVWTGLELWRWLR